MVLQKRRVKNIEICGKTGTAENPHGEDHSIFIAFAPKTILKLLLQYMLKMEAGALPGQLQLPV